MQLFQKIGFCFALLLGISLCAVDTKVDIHTGDDVAAFEPMMQKWCGVHFAPYPYLYAAPENKIECPPPGLFINANDAFLLLGNIEGEPQGMLAAIALDSPSLNGGYFPVGTSLKLQEKGFNTSEILYIAMFLIEPEYRYDKGFINKMYDQLVDCAKKLGKTKICYIDIIIPEDNLLRPAVFTSPEPWGEIINGFVSMDYTVNLNWNTFQADGSVKDESHTLLFYIKDL